MSPNHRTIARLGISLLLFMLMSSGAFAKHIKGGWIQYVYKGPGSASNTTIYDVTVYLYISCATTGPTGQVILGVFDAVTNLPVSSKTILNNGFSTLNKTSYDHCLSDPPSICYMIYTYHTTIELTNNTNGYTLTVQDAFRSIGIVNIVTNSGPQGQGSNGITFTATIPGVINGVDYHKNTSPFFIFKDTAIICYQAPFTYQFSATDVDGDKLSYSFGNGLNVFNPGGNTSGIPPASPPYPSLNYTNGYSGTSPLGGSVTIDSSTGVISGTAPSVTGEYVVAVYVKERRNGVVINITKKELQINVTNCTLTAAALKPQYINCDNFSFNFQNESTSSNIASYFWDFGVKNSTADTSGKPSPVYTYADTGTYTVKLKVSSLAGCSDSTSSTVKVYPGFTPAFSVKGSCYQSPFVFTDESLIKYGKAISWSWNFGDINTATDTSTFQNTSHLYAGSGIATVSLNVNSDKGCSGTVTKSVVINNKPDIYLPFTDTLICSIDSLPLLVQSSSATSFSWSPSIHILNSTTNHPTVFPKDSTVFTVVVKDKGCIDSATVKVNVLDFIKVSLTDVSMCRTDSIQLSPVSDALSYVWTESGGGSTLSSHSIKYPNASPAVTTLYSVTANLGHCQDSTKATVFVSPYPSAIVSADTAVCFGSSAQLHASTSAAYYNWSPVSSLQNVTTLNPVASPSVTTDYYFTVRDTVYCTKPTTDTITVTVIQPIIVHAGNDTSIVVGQSLQLNAGSTNNSLSYSWQPFTGLNNAYIFNPVANFYSTAPDSVTYVVTGTTPQGCSGSDAVTIKIFKTAPEIFVPTGFTPDGDGRNDLLKPILAGIARFDFFKVYNRWGQLIFSTTIINKGWDGAINGVKQPAGTYVFMASGNDYLGNKIFRKGTSVLIR